MLMDVLKKASWQSVAEGVQICRVPGPEKEDLEENILKKKTFSSNRLELFFCCGGACRIQYENENIEEVKKDDILLLSDLSDTLSVTIEQPITGFFVIIDPQCCSAIQKIYAALDYTEFCAQSILKNLDRSRGIRRIQYGGWNQGIFAVLRILPETEQGRYCLLKAAELFYLINSCNADCGEKTIQRTMPKYLVDILNAVASYIENHLDEKLTIPVLCRQFNISATTLKNKFREFYGQSIHSWILNCRIHKAAELLQFTDITVLQAAQSVGYESVSQFNVAFRQIYGITPSLYRKNVRNKKKLSDSVGNQTDSSL